MPTQNQSVRRAIPLKTPSFCKAPSFRGLTAESNKYEKMVCYLDPTVKPLDDATICFNMQNSNGTALSQLALNLDRIIVLSNTE
ncbi:MAG: palindromic element RPE4 domain-containing protein [Gammaproteobacteria bacterium]|nr:palindromic element RPE4 domain-containing protein [Gammaproteobacteria bacterium]